MKYCFLCVFSLEFLYFFSQKLYLCVIHFILMTLNCNLQSTVAMLIININILLFPCKHTDM